MPDENYRSTDFIVCFNCNWVDLHDVTIKQLRKYIELRRAEYITKILNSEDVGKLPDFINRLEELLRKRIESSGVLPDDTSPP